MRRAAVLLMGPTGAGKTDLSLRLAELVKKPRDLLLMPGGLGYHQHPAEFLDLSVVWADVSAVVSP